ncbi:hypothetical protein HMH01_09890 [Halovulum dunhuangense]|uniref:Uncharacterized protein n=1 Tax=Halovulum dunhuangense TaxID=1505036 RepID=A0A849L3I9_9RHOB|nr:hypothetical protein [Halovulum dunhuangense]NNU80747.1 hypothetical protein [Halovulum dunhuangense]
MPFLGASIIAGVIFFVLNLGSTLLLDPSQRTMFGALLEAAVKTAVFSTLFHYSHNWIARLLGWYRIDEPEASHRFDRTPALDQIREKGGS